MSEDEKLQGHLGIAMAATTTQRVMLRHMEEMGEGSVGIDLT